MSGGRPLELPCKNRSEDVWEALLGSIRTMISACMATRIGMDLQSIRQLLEHRRNKKIQHQADPQTGCSKGETAYTIKNNIRWVATRSNMKDEYKKVYKYELTAVATIDPSNVTPYMIASLAPPTSN
ncbi:hypothetical protein V6N11_054627 [Hibiscus sabdariffa]|uniref:Uncharacterized protein n=1 Tax=Hibiscus sabdariffa TaxID=183260 RepID=A0ABR2S594_9ROSI